MTNATAGSLSFLAGKCHWDGVRVTADRRRGRLSIFQSSEDGLCHVQWSCRGTGQVEDDLIVINDAYLERVPECTTGRVYVLRYKTSDKILLCWMQEPDASKDEQLVKCFNEITRAEDPTESGAASAIPPSSLHGLPSAPNGHTVSAAAGPQGGDSQGNRASHTHSKQLSQLMNQFVTRWNQQQEGSQYRSNDSESAVCLADILRSDVMLRLAGDESALEDIKRFLPESHRNDEKDIQDALRSSQFQQAVHSLDQVINQADDLPVVLTFLGVDQLTPDETARAEGPVEILVNAMMKKYNKKENPSAVEVTEEPSSSISPTTNLTEHQEETDVGKDATGNPTDADGRTRGNE